MGRGYIGETHVHMMMNRGESYVYGEVEKLSADNYVALYYPTGEQSDFATSREAQQWLKNMDYHSTGEAAETLPLREEDW